jgi:hypothetical protein
MRVDKLLEKGDVERAAIWKRIVGAIASLLQKNPLGGESTH